MPSSVFEGLVVDAPNRPPQVRTLHGPGELHRHEVRLRTAVAGICHTDIHYWEGRLPSGFPAVLGHEASATVIEVGSAVSSVRIGDRVVVCLSVYCGECRACISGRTHLCMNKAATRRRPEASPRLTERGRAVHQLLDVGAFAQEMVVHHTAVTPIPDELSMEQAALLGCSVTTGFGAVFRTAQVQPGQAVVVIGCGSVGVCCVQASSLVGANPIIAVDPSPGRRDLARSLGATHAISTDEVLSFVLETTAGGADHVFEAVGTPATIELAFDILAPGGTATVAGAVGATDRVSIPGFALLYEKRLQGCNMGSNHPQTDIPRYAQMILAGQVDVDSLITERIDLDDVARVLAGGQTGLSGRSLVVMH